MANSGHLQLLQYWRNTLADAARVEIQVDKTIHQNDAVVDYDKGKVEQGQAIRIITAIERRLNLAKGRREEDVDWEHIQETSVLLAPLCVSPNPEYTKYSGETGIFYPFWIRAILNRNGGLKPDEDSFPYIPRTHLEPQINEAVNFIFSDVDKIDEVFAKPFAGGSAWTAYWRYIQACFISITGIELFEYVIEGHTVNFSNTIVVNDTLTSTADGIISLYDYLLQEREIPVLLEALSEQSYTTLRPLLGIDEFERASRQHLGQMAYEYPLSISQRKGLYHFHTLKHGEILAVNGPPGTGKTTLLQSVVGNEVVLSAIKGEDPAIILACSTNNQAVTNIIDSFFSAKQKPGRLYERWLPEVNGFGLYLPAQGRTVSGDIPHIKRIAGKLSGAHTAKENNAYLDKAEKYFVNQFESHFGLKGLSVSEITQHIQVHLKEKQADLEGGIKLWQQYKNISLIIQKLEPDPGINLFRNQELDEEKLNQIETTIKDIELRVSDYLDKESFWIKLFAGFRFVKEKRATRLKQLFRNCPLVYQTIDFYQIPSLHVFFDEKLQLLNQIKNCHRSWEDWKRYNHIQSNPPLNDDGFKIAELHQKPFFYDELEMGLKYDLFYLAIHYWEGRWIMATKEVVTDDRTSKNGKADAQKRWQRFAMLTPCFVSTFFMAPKLFTYSRLIKTGITKSTWETPPLLDFVDLLIVDEAGQVSPEIGAVTFALAKRAIVVGDTLQIEPVWNVPDKVDHANLYRYEVIKNRDDQKAIDDLYTKGFLSSSGSIMKLAQKASPYHLYPKMNRGMMLTEHRRCFDEIIEYCNRLAYNGLLEPKKGPARDIPFTPMQFIAVAGASSTNGRSRSNREEALAITQWILINQQQLIHHYQEVENIEARSKGKVARKLLLSDILGIITPFTGQKNELTAAFRQAGINISGLTIGTVHALQGAERPVILFSATYGSNDEGKGYFFDRGVNMLNVAVSRAKDAFIFFGCKEVFKRKGNTPSIQLYNYILNTK